METTGTGTETETMRDVVVNYFFVCFAFSLLQFLRFSPFAVGHYNLCYLSGILSKRFSCFKILILLTR